MDAIEKLDSVIAELETLEKLANAAGTLEKQYYDPIVKLGNAIVTELSSRPTLQGTRFVDWVDCLDMTPSSVDSSGAKIRTDIGLVMRSDSNRKQLQVIGEQIAKYSQERDEAKKKSGRAKRKAGEETPQEKALVGSLLSTAIKTYLLKLFKGGGKEKACETCSLTLSLLYTDII